MNKVVNNMTQLDMPLCSVYGPKILENRTPESEIRHCAALCHEPERGMMSGPLTAATWLLLAKTKAEEARLSPSCRTGGPCEH